MLSKSLGLYLIKLIKLFYLLISIYQGSYVCENRIKMVFNALGREYVRNIIKKCLFCFLLRTNRSVLIFKCCWFAISPRPIFKIWRKGAYPKIDVIIYERSRSLDQQQVTITYNDIYTFILKIEIVTQIIFCFKFRH